MSLITFRSPHIMLSAASSSAAAARILRRARVWQQTACQLTTSGDVQDDPKKQPLYDQRKIERLVPDYDDIRDNNDVQHTPNVIQESSTLKEEYQEGSVAGALGGDLAGAASIAAQMAAGAAQGTAKVAAAATQRVVDLAGRAVGMNPSHDEPPSRTEQYKRMRKGGGAAHDQQDTAYEQARAPGEPCLEDKYPRAVEAAKLQAVEDQPVEELKGDLEHVSEKQGGEYES